MFKRLFDSLFPLRSIGPPRPRRLPKVPHQLKQCSFCCRVQADVGQLVEGPLHVFICLACAEASRELLLASKPPGGIAAPPEPLESPTATENAK